METVSNVRGTQIQQPTATKWMAILIGLTFMRAFMGIQLPSLEMYGGVNPDAWFAPWISDTILGILAPIMIYLVIKKKGIKTWGILVAYNAIGAFDYAHGILTQWTDPLIPNGIMGTPGLTYGAIGFSLVVQLIVLYLLFQPAVMSYFSSQD
ncbi:MAG: hypothetical protein F6K19_14150 [Cyanothece sp. SIO1E1]|nr:hypothetical protein [Cyanothece sp. SIO1E1]